MDNYWISTYGKRNKDFVAGVIAGVSTFAIWKNGMEVVGCMQKPLKDEIKKIEEMLEEIDNGSTSI